MSRKVFVALVAALLLAPAIPMGLAAAILTIKLDSRYYNAGGSITITGSSTAADNTPVTLVSTLPGMETIGTTKVTGGTYGKSFQIPSTAAVGLYTVTASVMIAGVTSTATTDFIVTSISISGVTTQFIQLAQSAKTIAQETLSSLKAAGKTVPSLAQTNLDDGIKALDKATSVQTTDPKMAIQQARLALVHFRNAIAIATRADKAQEKQEENRAILLTQQADRLQTLITKIEDSIAQVNQQTYASDISAIETQLSPAKTLITDAKVLIKAGSLDDAAAKLKTAGQDVQQALALYKGLVGKIRSAMLGDFKFHLKERLSAAEEDLKKMQPNLSLGAFNSAMASLGNAKGMVGKADDHEKAGRGDDEVNDLDEASQAVNVGLGGVGNAYGKGLMQVNLLRAQINVLQVMANQVIRKGGSATDIKAKIAQLQSLLDEAVGNLQGGNPDLANSLVDQARQNRQDLFHGLRGGG